MKLSHFYAAVVFVFIPVFAVRPMTTLYAYQLEGSMFEIGIITACYSLTPLLLAVHVGRYIDRFGERLPLLFGSLGILIALILPFFFPFIPILYISQLILGGSQLLAILAIQNGVAKAASEDKRDKAVGTFSIFSSSGMLIGPLLGGYSTEHIGFEKTFLILALMPIISMVISLFISHSPKKSTNSTQVLKRNSNSIKELFLVPTLSRCFIASMIILSALDLFYVYFPLYAQSFGLSLSQIGWILAIQAAANSLVRIFMTSLINRYGRVTILWTFMVIGAIAFGAIPLIHDFLYLFIISLVLGTGLGVTQPLTIILSYNASPSKRTGEVLGVRLASNRLSQTVMTIIFANLSTLIGLGPIFIIIAFLLIIGAWSASGISEEDQKMDIPFKQSR